MKLKLILGICFVILFLGIVAGATYQIYFGNKIITLSPIYDICGREFTAPQLTPEANKQMFEASELYKAGKCSMK